MGRIPDVRTELDTVSTNRAYDIGGMRFHPEELRYRGLKGCPCRSCVFGGKGRGAWNCGMFRHCNARDREDGKSVVFARGIYKGSGKRTNID